MYVSGHVLPYTSALIFFCFIATTSCVVVAIYTCFITCAFIYFSRLHIFWVVCRLHTWTTLTYLLTGLLTRSIIMSHAFAMSPTTTLNSLKVLTGVGCSLMHMGGNLWVWCFFYLHSSLVISFSHYIISWHNISSFIVSFEWPAPTLPRCPWLVTFHPRRQSLNKRPWGHPRCQCLKKKKSPVQPSLKD